MTLSAYLTWKQSQPIEQSSIEDHYSDQDPWFADPAESAEEQLGREQMGSLLKEQLSKLPERGDGVSALSEEKESHEIAAVFPWV